MTGETTGSGIPVEVAAYVLRRDRYRCRNCGNDDPEALHPHHVTYRSQGGGHTPDNQVTVCWKCHRDIHDKVLRVARVNNTFFFGTC